MKNIENDENFVDSAFGANFGNFVSMKLKYFNEHLSRDGSYKFYKLFVEDKDSNKNYCIKVNKSILYKLLINILNSEEFENEFRQSDRR